MYPTQSLYVLKVTENKEAFLYYCYVIKNSNTYSWILSREEEKLSYGEGNNSDIDLMLSSLSSDLALNSTERWLTITLH